ncbi:methyltransferase domain-containing protein [Phthorimaea operculella]|nr:methyltransferase domain-containing protein [Phthorimaea operculella]
MNIIPRIKNCRSFFRKMYSTMKNKETPDYISKNQERSTLDPEDLLKLKHLVHDWWDPEGSCRGLHSYNVIRIPFISDGLLQNSLNKGQFSLKGMAVLDVGCGGGLVSEALAQLGATVTGIDASKEQIQCATEHSFLNTGLDNKPKYICTTIEEHVKKHKNTYDGVVASEIIEHVLNQDLFVKSCVETLKPKGRIFFTTPNRTTMAQFKLIYYMEDVIKQIPKGTHQIDQFVTPEELRGLLEQNGCQVELTKGIDYKIAKNEWIWTQSQLFVYAMQAVKL